MQVVQKGVNNRNSYLNGANSVGAIEVLGAARWGNVWVEARDLRNLELEKMVNHRLSEKNSTQQEKVSSFYRSTIKCRHYLDAPVPGVDLGQADGAVSEVKGKLVAIVLGIDEHYKKKQFCLRQSSRM